MGDERWLWTCEVAGIVGKIEQQGWELLSLLLFSVSSGWKKGNGRYTKSERKGNHVIGFES